jgi:hypothetical protein
MAKADLELAIIKAESGSRLNEDEMLELLDIDAGTLMHEYDLDLRQVEQVLVYRKCEAQRWMAQIIMDGSPMLEESKIASTKRMTINELKRYISRVSDNSM